MPRATPAGAGPSTAGPLLVPRQTRRLGCSTHWAPVTLAMTAERSDPGIERPPTVGRPVLKHIEVAVDDLSVRCVPSCITSHRLSSAPRLGTRGKPPVFRRAPVSPHPLQVPWPNVHPRRCLSPEHDRYRTRSVARIAPVVSVEPIHLLSAAAAFVSKLFRKKRAREQTISSSSPIRPPELWAPTWLGSA